MLDLIIRFGIIGILVGQLCFAQACSASGSKREMVSIDAKPESILIDPVRSAVIVVDMENDFAAKGGMFDRAGIDISGAQKAIAQLEADVKAGAVGVGEIGKGFGLSTRKADGTLLRIDDPELDPIFEAAG